MGIILYSTGCPKCAVLKEKLDSKKINYEEISDVGIMQEKGIMSVPVLMVDDKRYDFASANDYINNLEGAK